MLPGYMLVTGLLITGYLVTGHRFMVPPLVAGCGLLAGVGMMRHAAIVFVRLPLGQSLGLKSNATVNLVSLPPNEYYRGLRLRLRRRCMRFDTIKVY